MDFELDTAGYDYDDQEAGALLGEIDQEDDVAVYDEAGVLHHIIPGLIAQQMQREGRMPKGKPGWKARRVKGSGRKRRGRWGKVFGQLRNLGRRLAALEARLGARTLDFGTTLPASPGEKGGFRPLLGGSLIIAAPGAVGPSPFGPLQIQPSNISQASSLVAAMWEDAPAAAAAGAEIPGSTPWFATNLTMAGSNVIRSAQPAAPSELFQVSGSHYGYPLGTGRHVDLPASTIVAVSGQFSPRTPGGASGAIMSAAILSPRVAA